MFYVQCFMLNYCTMGPHRCAAPRPPQISFVIEKKRTEARKGMETKKEKEKRKRTEAYSHVRQILYD